MSNFEQEIRQVIAEIIEKKPEEITPEAKLVEDLGADSMMALEILAALEKKYRVIVPEENLPKLTTLSKITELVDTLKKK